MALLIETNHADFFMQFTDGIVSCMTDAVFGILLGHGVHSMYDP